MDKSLYSNLWDFIEMYLPNYYTRDDVLRSDILYRFLDNEDVNVEDKKWIDENFNNNIVAIKQECKRLEMQVFPEDRFVDAVVKTVKANLDWVPPYGSGAALYLRPYMFGSNAVIGVKPATEFQFRIFTTPVGPYFKGGAKPITLRVPDFDRAAPRGTGHVKAGLNYAMSLHAIVDAHNEGYAENMYLDSATRTKVEETGGANFIFVTKDNTVVTPKSDTILPSITRRSLMYVAEHYLGLKTEEREVLVNEIKDFKEFIKSFIPSNIAKKKGVSNEKN